MGTADKETASMETYNGKPWIKRDLEDELLDSLAYGQPHIGYWIRGLKGAGKTSLLMKFGQTRHKRFYSIDLTDQRLKNELEQELHSVYMRNIYDDYHKGNADLVFKKFIPGFVDDPDSFLLLDEIQESMRIYNLAKQILRGLDAKVAFCGSFLGDSKESNYELCPLGEVSCFDLLPVTYREFVGSITALKSYASSDLFAPSQDHGSAEALTATKPYWEVYNEIGGFPAPLLESMSLGLQSASFSRDAALDSYIQTIAKKTHYGFSSDWSKLIGFIVSNALSEVQVELGSAPALEMTSKISLKLITKLLEWLEGSGALSIVSSVSDLRERQFFTSSKFMFTNYELLRRLAFASGTDKTLALHKSAKLEAYALNELRALKSMYEPTSLTSFRETNSDAVEEVVFTFKTPKGARVLLEAKGADANSAGSLALANRDADFLISLCAGAGSIRGNKLTLSLCNSDKLKKAIELINFAYATGISLEEAYSRMAQGAKAEV
jgi:predicted AAA+ superfamily ATPase